jgi:hypothetical protein
MGLPLNKYSFSNRNALLDLQKSLSEDSQELKLLRPIEPIETWINSEYYTGPLCKDIWPYWKETMIEFFTPPIKNIFIAYGSLGGGKTRECLSFFIRLIYELSCYNNPMLKFGLAKTSPIIFFFLTPSIKVSEITGFKDLREMIDLIPYFNECYPRNKDKDSVLEFDNGRIQVHTGSQVSHFRGSNLYSVILDEASFQRGGDIAKFQGAQEIYRESTNRRKSRFMHDKVEYGVSMIASSADTITSFTETEVEKNKNNPKALVKYVKKYSLKPKDFSDQKITVFKGLKDYEPFLLDLDNKDRYKAILEFLGVEDIDQYIDYEDITNIKVPELYKDLFVNPPIDFYTQYKTDVYNTLKEVDGVAVQNELKFFTEASMFYSCVNPSLKHPFSKEEIELSTETKENDLIRYWLKGDPDNIIEDKKLNKQENLIDNGVRGIPGINYYVRMDLSKTGDSTGIAMGHYDKKINKVIIDFQLIVHPPKYPFKIDFDKIKDFIMFLKNKRGYKIKNITFDQYASDYFIQYFEKRHMDSYLLSVDRTDKPYLFLKEKIIKGQLEFYHYARFEFELFNLIHDMANKKVDHPPKQKNKQPKDGGWGKDISDAICGLVYTIFIKEGINDVEINPLLKTIAQRYNEGKNKFTKDSILKKESKLLHTDVNSFTNPKAESIHDYLQRMRINRKI